MSYFHTGIRTIIGAEAFHGPVRDGKEWYHLAMVIRHNLSTFRQGPEHPIHRANQLLGFECVTWHNNLGLHQSYRVKPHEQLVLVSLTHYCASTPSLSTSWS